MDLGHSGITRNEKADGNLVVKPSCGSKLPSSSLAIYYCNQTKNDYRVPVWWLSLKMYA